MLAELTGTADMERRSPSLEPLVAGAGLVDLQSGEAPWMRYVCGRKPA